MNDVIIACDVKDKASLYELLQAFENERPYLKIGMELFYKEGPSIVKELKDQGYKIFLDLKLHDIPNTVYKAMKNVASLKVDMVNIHAQGGIEMMQAAKRAIDEVNPSTKLIAVTILTSLSQDAMKSQLLIQEDLNTTVKHYAKNVKEANLDGVVCSPLEAPIISELGLISVTPGIRFADNTKDDQKRVTTPSLAKELGSTYIVVGRSITQAKSPLKAYKKCLEDFVQ
jgi:orotidine-5'-phosphate decarboxylase